MEENDDVCAVDDFIATGEVCSSATISYAKLLVLVRPTRQHVVCLPHVGTSWPTHMNKMNNNNKKFGFLLTKIMADINIDGICMCIVQPTVVCLCTKSALSEIFKHLVISRGFQTPPPLAFPFNLLTLDAILKSKAMSLTLDCIKPFCAVPT